MNCCNHNNDKNHHGKGHMSHLWMMILCCGAPLLVLLLLPLLGTRFPGISLFLASIAPFLCPVLMIGMIPMMFMKDRHEEKTAPRTDECDGHDEIQRLQK